jgi:exocyst complex component 8
MELSNAGEYMSPREVTAYSNLLTRIVQALYKNVEGSQKFLPNTSGRHVLQNAGPWIELDHATYKSRRAMQIFLLNDHLLIASRKKRKMDGPGGDARGPATKLVADRCWPLLDIEVIDMAGSGEASSGGRNKLADAIMVRGLGQDSFIYRTEKTEDTDKQVLMINIRKAVEELRRSHQAEMEASNKAKETINYFASRDPGLLQKTELLETLSDIKDMLIEVDGKQQNLRWVEGEMDELDINVAHQRFEPAVAGVEKLKGLARGLKNNAVAQDFINFKVDERCGRLATLIIRELEATHNDQSKTRRNVGWLTRLGFEDRAREAYLVARSDTIQKRYRCVPKASGQATVANQLQAMHIPGRLASLHLGDFVCLLQDHPKHGCLLPGVLPAARHEHMCALGQERGGSIQCDPGPPAQRHAP